MLGLDLAGTVVELGEAVDGFTPGQEVFGMAGGIGGFALAAGMGAIKQSTGSYQLALWLFASLGVLAWFGLHGVKRRWRTTWGSAAVTAARV